MEGSFTELNRELAEVKIQMAVRDKLFKRLEQARQTMDSEKIKSAELRSQLRKEELDVEKLEGLSLTNLNNEMQLTENEKGLLLKEKLALLEKAE
ncbi:MAG: hypothetical protein ACYC21_10540 [Eubacteriales bacterium]